MAQRSATDGAGPLERPAADLSARRILVLVTLALVPVLLVAALWIGQKAIFLLFAGILFAALLDAATRLIAGRTGLARGWALGIVIGTMVVAIAAVIGLGGTWLASQAGELYAALQAQARRIGDMIDFAAPSLEAARGRETLAGTLRDLGRMFGGTGGGPVSMAQAVLGALANAFIIFFVGVFLALDPDLYKRGLVRLFPVDRRGEVDGALHGAGETLRDWLVGKLLAMAAIGALTLVGLLVIGYPLAVPLALLAGLLAFVPNLGPLLTYVPIALAGISAGTGTMLAGVAVYAVAQTLESYILTPLIQKRMVSLPPALILVAQVLGGILFGLWGVALATPLAAVLRLWVERHYVRGTLESGARGADPER